MTNLSVVSDAETARTRRRIARQRAENLACYGVRRCLELCVGPSMKELHGAYWDMGIHPYGNDIDERWRTYFPHTTWRMGDCLSVSYTLMDAVVFAPPLSRGCTGARADALMIDEVQPRYTDFLDVWAARRLTSTLKIHEPRLAVLVLPGRCLSTKEDRAQYFKLLTHCLNYGTVEPIEMVDGCRKYVDVYIHA